MPLIAQQRLTWGDGIIEIGEPVPEWEPGRNYDQMKRLGMIAGTEDTPPPGAAEKKNGLPSKSTVAKMSKPNLVALGAEHGVDLDVNVLKKLLVAEIEALR